MANTDANSSGKKPAFDKNAALKRISDVVLTFAGKPETFFAVCGLIALWLVLGALFGFDDYWYAIVQTVGSIITLLMVFIIQDSQNRDTATLHLKLDELIRANAKASNELLDLEHLTREQLDKILARYKDLAASAGSPAQGKAEQAIDDALSKVKNAAS